MPEILVTGATGTIGPVVAEYFISYSTPCRVLVRHPEKLAPHIAKRFEIAQGDYQKPDSLEGAFEGIKKLFMVSPASKDKKELESAVIDQAKKAGVEYIVRISAMGADPDSRVLMIREHAAVDQYLQKSGIPYTILRPHSFMQNLLGFAPTIAEEGKIYAPMGYGEIPMIDARDIGEVAANLLIKEGHENEILDLTGPNPISYQDIAESLTKQLQKDITYVPIPGEAAYEAMVKMQMPDFLARDLVTMMEIWESEKTTPATSSVKEVLGRTPRSIGEFLSDYLDAFRS